MRESRSFAPRTGRSPSCPWPSWCLSTSSCCSDLRSTLGRCSSVEGRRLSPNFPSEKDADSPFFPRMDHRAVCLACDSEDLGIGERIGNWEFPSSSVSLFSLCATLRCDIERKNSPAWIQRNMRFHLLSTGQIRCAGQLSQPHHLFVDSEDNILVPSPGVQIRWNPCQVYFHCWPWACCEAFGLVILYLPPPPSFESFSSWYLLMLL